MRNRIVVLLVLITAGSVVALFFGALAYFNADERGLAQSRLSLYSRSLSDTLERFEYLPHILTKDPMVSQALQSGQGTEINNKFAEFANEAKLEAIYLLDVTGLVIASSNYDQSPTFVGKNYGFRPYFKSAIKGEDGRFFGVGATTGRPGYFFAQPVLGGSGEVLGVLTVKLDMSEFQSSWETSDENILVTNANGVVVLGANPDWLYRSIVKVPDGELDLIHKSRQFGEHKILPLKWSSVEDEVDFDGQKFLHVTEKKEDLNWVVHLLQEKKRVYERAGFATGVFGSAVVALILMATFLRSIRIQNALQRAQADRNRLQVANDELANAHDELKKTGHLAALGRLAASVTHELGQPISALKNYLSAGEISGEFQRLEALPKVERVIERMENIAKDLRVFTQFQPNTHCALDFNDVVKSAIELTQHDIDAQGCSVRLIASGNHLTIYGNQFRLERVAMNLIRNALEAMKNEKIQELSITTGAKDDQHFCRFADTGHGVDGKNLEQLCEPFHTTKPSGSGMGLGLSIVAQILNEHQGELFVEAGERGGAVFEIRVPVMPNDKVLEMVGNDG